MIVFTVLLPYYLVIKTDFVHFTEHSLLNSARTDWVVKYFCFRVQHYTFPPSPTGKKRCICMNAPHASMGLATMLFGVSGSCDDMEATSLPVELEPGPPSEKLTCREGGEMKNSALIVFIQGLERPACVCIQVSECVGAQICR